MSFDGSINAYIGADTKDYEKSMNEIVSNTKKRSMMRKKLRSIVQIK